MRLARLAACTLVLLALAGCSRGPKLVIVKGKLTNNGKSILADRNSGVTIIFVPVAEEDRGNTYPAAGFNSQEDRFEVPGRDLKGIPVGKYKVTITIMGAK